ncbi:hypothetical protein PyrSV_gp36 [Pyrobaculum spherical virus]|uniref:Uncharacterized protein n=1 Tax=Pyrobaculum spherical virus (isolate United States/Yellowstone) TaxID=654907 RepID=Q6ZYG7_PSVY|nr:hypothetical protein PyrSV_gp36 [Pyrobaculum spherical virus]CAG25655.1 hypothetical protein [Pyrobaculum spherical virus]
MPKSIWELEEEVRRLLLSGVEFQGRKVGATVGADWFKWVKLEETNPRRLLAIYVKEATMVTVYAIVSDDDKVDIISVSLDRMCRGGGAHA